MSLKSATDVNRISRNFVLNGLYCFKFKLPVAEFS